MTGCRIQFEESVNFCLPSVVQISQKKPPTMDSEFCSDSERFSRGIPTLVLTHYCFFPLFTGHVSKVEWETYTSKIDKSLKQLTAIRAMIYRIVMCYAVIMAAYFVCVEVFDLLEDYRLSALAYEILASLGLLFLIIFLYNVKARCSVIGAIKRRSATFNQDVCPRLTLRCSLPFFQFTGGIAKGWYIAVSRKSEQV